MKVVVVGAGVAVLVACLALLHASSKTEVAGNTPAGPRSLAPVPATRAQPPLSFGSAPAAEPPHESPSPAAARSASADVWRVLRTTHANVAAERDDLVAAFRAAPACGEAWCEKGRAALAAWQAAITAKVPGVLSTEPIECSAAGCFVQVAVADPIKWRDVKAALPTVTAEANWQGPTIQGGPDYQTKKGSVISIWAILPDEPNEPASPQEGQEP